MNLFRRLDDSILKCFTKISHAYQILTGKTNFFLAKLALFFSGIIFVTIILNYFHPILSHKTDLFLMLMTSLLVLVLVVYVQNCNKIEDEFQSSGNLLGLFILQAVKDRYLLRVMWIWFGCLSSSEIIYHLSSSPPSILLFFAEVLFDSFGLESFFFFYFIAVTPLPPCKGKIRELLRSLFKASARASVSVPEKG